METVQSIKQRFSIIGNDTGLNRAVEKAVQCSPYRYFGFSYRRKWCGKRKYSKNYTSTFTS